MTPPTSTPTARARRKLPRPYAPVVFAFYMSAIMALLMCAAIVGINSGLSDGYVQRVLGAYVFAMPIAFGCVLLVRPLVVRLVAATVDL
ncbi:DUF2798 domain-containing protein [Comamonas terrigena]|uniref:DUF2798 domain-containing protein n=1 Tax=Comamonas terrigena TaxID=32013 RepID=UPI0024477616|nr:DUF2798 domain-containing protein [Comamonas terrigena]MDH0048440.1 DUF2798 domain-containing protein [Comamonas terrigena]MDH0510848.1 DUF2798 domain-containing protein [Comamonas terrigena]MDH1090245.1 DUF2798 domain-containing protein [Comamonas terrigena]MDH1499600.1 DUF2798 domain-containing protein [Comamonas terrigena]